MNKYPSSETVFAEKGQAMSTEERQPADMDEKMIERARDFGPVWVEQHPDQPKSWHSGSWSDEALVEFGAAFASIIQAEARQVRDKAWMLTLEHLGCKPSAANNPHAISWRNEGAEAAEQQLASQINCTAQLESNIRFLNERLEREVGEARAQGMREAAAKLRETIASGRTINNFRHVPSVVRALEWVLMDFDAAAKEIDRAAKSQKAGTNGR